MTKFIADSEKAKIDLANLMTDMALKGATPEEITRVIRYSMAVMDACKEYNIPELINKYQDDSETLTKPGQAIAREDFVNKTRLTNIYERLSKPNKKAIDGYGRALEEIDRLKDCEANLGLICESLGVDSVTDAIRKISLLNS